MSHSLFISDLHLCDERPDLTQAFFTFIEEKALEAQALYILGDFFNVWIGDDNDSKLTPLIARMLSALQESGTRVYLMHGNRDFLIGGHYANVCGATLLDDPSLEFLYGRPYLLMHGDSLCTRDTDYMRLRAQFRDLDWQDQFLDKPLEERKAFAEQARAQSKAMSSNKAEDIMDVTEAEVLRMLDENGAPCLIHGHTHRPAVHELGDNRKRIVLGDWDKNGWYLRVDEEGEELISFPIER